MSSGSGGVVTTPASTRQLLLLLACVSTLFAGALIGSVFAIELLAFESVELPIPMDDDRMFEPSLPQGRYVLDIVIPDHPSLPESMHVALKGGGEERDSQTLYSREVAVSDCPLRPSEGGRYCDLAILELTHEQGRALVVEASGTEVPARLSLSPPPTHVRGRWLGLFVIAGVCLPAALMMVFVMKASAESANTV